MALPLDADIIVSPRSLQPLYNIDALLEAVAKLIPGPLRIVAHPPAEFGVEIDSSGDPSADFAPLLAEVENALPALCRPAITY